MQVRPMFFQCPQHGVDLTGRVRTQLQHQAGPVFGFHVSAAPLEMRMPQPFAVHVHCPGGPRGDAHALTATGTYVP